MSNKPHPAVTANKEIHLWKKIFTTRKILIFIRKIVALQKSCQCTYNVALHYSFSYDMPV